MKSSIIEFLLAGRGRRAFARHRACGGSSGWTQCCRRLDTSDYVLNRVLCEKFGECPKIRRYSSHIYLRQARRCVLSDHLNHSSSYEIVGAQLFDHFELQFVAALFSDVPQIIRGYTSKWAIDGYPPITLSDQIIVVNG